MFFVQPFRNKFEITKHNKTNKHSAQYFVLELILHSVNRVEVSFFMNFSLSLFISSFVIHFDKKHDLRFRTTCNDNWLVVVNPDSLYR